MHKLTYRPDIDGLRAIAVIAVILFHATVPGFRGGYIGVDVFFVISGYLITLLLTEAGDVSPRRRLAVFYLRRARRILPAISTMLVVVTLVAAILLLPSDLIKFGKYLAAAPALVSNIAAWSDGGYFDVNTFNFGLIHLWSISVEEQFYLVYPLALLIIDRYSSSHRLAVLTAIALLSFALCVWGSYHRPFFNYYGAPTRAWELLLGATGAIGNANWSAHRLLDEIVAGLCLVAIALSVHYYSNTMIYPGLLTLVPCVATVLLLVTGRSRTTWAARILSSPPLVLTGLISYSLYLWHLPILAFVNYYLIKPLGAFALAMSIAAIFILAYASWKLIEQPIRRAIVLRSTRVFVATAVGANVVFLAVGLVVWRSNGFPQRFSPDVQALVATGEVYHRDLYRCITVSLEAVKSGDLCRYGSSATNAPRVLVWGDSHATALLPAFEDFAVADSLNLYFGAWPACKPLWSAAKHEELNQSAACMQFNAALKPVVEKLQPDLVILVAHWTYIDNNFFAHDPETPGGESQFQRVVDETLQAIDAPERKVCVVLDAPTVEARVPYALAMARRRSIDETFVGVSREEAMNQYREVDRDFRTLEERGRLTTVDLKDALCGTDRCVYRIGDNPLYFDDNHVSVTGARFVAGTLKRCFADLHRTR